MSERYEPHEPWQQRPDREALREARGDASAIFTKFAKKERSRGAIAVAVALHVLFVVVIGSILLDIQGVSFGELKQRWSQPTERIHYVRVAPPAPAAPAPAPRLDTGSVRRPTTPTPPRPRTGGEPAAPGRAPSTTPNELPPPTASGGISGGVPGGTGTGGDGGTAVTGVTPGYSDPRIWTPPTAPVAARKTTAQKVDSTILAAFGVYADSVATAQATKGRDPGDWTFGKDGQKWGVDPKWVHLGKVKIPTALIGLLPINGAQANPQAMQNARTAAFVRQDILYHAQKAQSEDDFRKAVKRIRERKERERKEQQEAKKNPPPIP
jgi:hypothetical protein